MSALFARVVKQALITFERENYAAFKSNFNTLKQLVDQLTSNDLNISSELLGSNSFQQSSSRAPVKYIEICEHKSFTMSVFIVVNKYTMPLHDHPGHGLLRVISGTARIQSYSLEHPLQNTPHILSVIEEDPIEFSAKNGCSVLTPTTRNIHEITATGSCPAAFFDILSPPYESDISLYGPKKCLFYRKIPFKPVIDSPNRTCSRSNSDDDDEQDHNTNDEASDKSKQIAYLQQVRAPNHYYCDNVYYNPPEFIANLNLLNGEEAA
ncbi:2-aminoethanethiol dioxygenase [Contarinia nasturtii]|uniref:2-aminoethanethiol dioxygenase n=1 Tax=Contarinia nasturtii TaxID=265458 RepID=UPI0012D4237D|nr:2-aminoethanethiol dioxygenase [Contarinia nasturtii]